MSENRPAAIQADYCNYKRVRGRRVMVLELEVPLEREREVIDVLGFPDPATGCPVAIAPLQTHALEQTPDPAGKPPRKRWSELPPAQQAALRCQDPTFSTFLHRERGWVFKTDSFDEAEAVRRECRVSSRSELNTNSDAAALWDALDREYRRWAGLEAEER